MSTAPEWVVWSWRHVLLSPYPVLHLLGVHVIARQRFLKQI